MLAIPLIIYLCVFVVNKTKKIQPPTSQSTLACYKVKGKKPVYLTIERNQFIGDWPNILSFKIKIVLLCTITSTKHTREEKYILHYQSSESCFETFNISDDNINGIGRIDYEATLFLGYFENPLCEFYGSFTMNKTLGFINLPDTYGLIYIKTNVKRNHSPAITKVVLSSKSDYYTNFPRYIDEKQRCIVIINLQKSHVIHLNTDNNLRIPYFQEIMVSVKNNKLTEYENKYPAYPSVCSHTTTNIPLQKVLFVVRSPISTSKVRWEIKPKVNLQHSQQHNVLNSGQIVEVSFSNEETISIFEQKNQARMNFCSSYISNSIFLFKTFFEILPCVKNADNAINIKTVDLRLSLETIIEKTESTSSGHKYKKRNTLPSCINC